MAWSIVDRKIFPSPMAPVEAVLTDFRQKTQRIFMAAIDFGVVLLHAATADIHDCHAVYTQVRQNVPYSFEFCRPDNCFEFGHFVSLPHNRPLDLASWSSFCIDEMHSPREECDFWSFLSIVREREGNVQILGKHRWQDHTHSKPL